MLACPFHYTQHRTSDQGLIDRFIDEFPLAMITSCRDGKFLCSHIPLWRQSDGSLFGHVDGNNPQFKDEHLNAQIVFMGPSAYIPPQAYVTRQLPTWNYLAVHMQAKVVVLGCPSKKLEILKHTAKRLAVCESDYQVDEGDSRVVSNLANIRGLVVQPEYTEGRFKVSQDKSPSDSSAALQYLLGNQKHDCDELLKEILHATTKPHLN